MEANWPRMPCDCGCGAHLTATEMRLHFSHLREAAETQAMDEAEKVPLLIGALRASGGRHHNLCSRCRAGQCRLCAWRIWYRISM
jgi:hypothetical protein